MTRRTVRCWYLVHKWTSLACTLFLLMLCLSGLPLIFSDEIEALGGGGTALSGPASSGTDPALLPLDAVLRRALANRPGEVALFMAFDNQSPLTTVTTGPSADAPAARMTLQLLDRTSGRSLSAQAEHDGGVMDFLLQLHTDMFLGQPGMFFLGFMGLLFAVALVSGTVLYAPFMRKLDFGTIRSARSRRLKWLDYHNLLGIVALAWMAVVGITGVINAFGEPIIALWRAEALAGMTAAQAPQSPADPARRVSLDRAMAAARAALPGTRPQFIAFPGGTFSTPQHFAVFFQGNTPATERLLTPALIDAATGRLADARPMPWYAQALFVSQPLHFGDYGGLPLKILWAVLDGFTIVVLGSGIYLWLGRRRSPLDGRVREVASGGRVSPEPRP